MADLRSARALFDEFKAATNRGDLQNAKQKLSKLKLILTQLPGLPPRLEQTPTAQQELLLARDVLELAVFLSIRLQDEAAFERNYLQLSTYYTDARHLTPPSPAEPLVVALNLLRLLVQNRVAEFHTELETLSPEVRGSEHARLVTQLEQWLMEGAYGKVLAARQAAPDPAFAYLLERLLATVRDEIAGCSEAAYASLTVPEAKRLLLLGSDGELAEYARERGWQLEGGSVRFSPPEAEDAGEVPALKVISNTLTYARELERIV